MSVLLLTICTIFSYVWAEKDSNVSSGVAERGGGVYRTVTVIGCMTTNLIVVNNHVDWLNVCARACVYV